jgi:hypothetical protein
MGVFGKQPFKSNEDQETELFNPVAQDKTGFNLQQYTINRESKRQPNQNKK